MILAPTLTLNALRGPSVDPDAAAYAAASGATDVAALSAFVKGVKDLGLWESMVCWPLRSTQNAGTGTTAYSLGGLGTYNGTLVNGPTWGADGLAFIAASTQRISTSAILNVGSSGAVYNATDNSADQTLISSRNGAAWSTGVAQFVRGFSNIGRAAYTATDVARYRAAAAAAYGSVQFDQANYTLVGTSAASDTTIRQNKDAQQAGSLEIGAAGNVVSATTALVIGAEGPSGTARNMNGTLSVVYVATSRFSEAQQDALYDLYKTTLGTGLGLP
jgi:hypothetical protein